MLLGTDGVQQLGGGAGRAGTCVVYRPLLAGSGARFHVRGSERVPRPLLTNRCQLFKRRLAIGLLDRNSLLKTLRAGERCRGATIKLAAGSVHQALRTTQQVVRADQRPSALLNQLVLEICGRVPARGLVGILVLEHAALPVQTGARINVSQSPMVSGGWLPAIRQGTPIGAPWQSQ